ncbi:MAG: GNAT family N-acetyltransferase [Saccharofermentanales bacterium]
MKEKMDPVHFKIREANMDDARLIYDFILEMAEYERESDEVETDTDKIRDTICNKRFAEALIGEYDGRPVAYAVFFHSYSTYLGKPSIYLEDLFVKPEFRGNGFGKTILGFLANLTIERNCGRFDWSCLDWNESSISFYLKLGAEALDNRTIYRLHGRALEEMRIKNI